MPFNGAGVFNRLYSWVNDAANGIKIRADRMDNEMNGMATGLTTCVTRDGQSPATANLPMGGFKHTNAAAATSVGEYLTLGQVATLNQNGNSVIGLTNTDPGVLASCIFRLMNAAHVANMTLYGTGFTTVGSEIQDSMRLATNGDGGLVIESTANAPIVFWVNGLQRMILDSTGHLGIGLNPFGGNLLSVGGDIGSTGIVNAAAFVAAPAGTAYFEARSFGVSTFYETNLITSNGGGWLDIVCQTVGVRLLAGDNHWTNVSTRSLKKDIQPIPGDPFEIINNHEVALFHYLEDPEGQKLRPGMFYEDAIAHYPWAASYVAAQTHKNEESGETKEYPEHKGLSLEQYVPLLMAAFQKQIQVNEDLQAQIDNLREQLLP